jgi:hypothetical protein
VRRSSKDLDLIFALQFERTVNRDNTVSVQNLRLQIEPVRWRATLAGCSVTVQQHLDGSFTITHGPQRLGHYSAEGVSLEQEKIGARGAVEKTQGGKVQKSDFSALLGKPAKGAEFPLSHSLGCDWPINLNWTFHGARKTGHFNLLPTRGRVAVQSTPASSRQTSSRTS